MKNHKYKWHMLKKLHNLINIGMKRCQNIKQKQKNYKNKLLIDIKYKWKSLKNKYSNH